MKKTLSVVLRFKKASSLALAALASLVLPSPSSAQTIMASETGTNSIISIAPDGSKTTFVSGLNLPEGLVYNSAGNLYVANYGTNSVLMITPDGTVSTFATGLASPVGLAIDGSDNIYVASYGGSAVYKITAAGDVSTFASLPFTNAVSLAFNGSGNLFVNSIVGSDGVYSITPAGEVAPFVSSTAFKNDFGLAFSGSDLFVSNLSDGKILKVTSGGEVSEFAAIPGQATGLLADGSGGLFVGSAAENLYHVSSEGLVSVYATGLNDVEYMVFQSSIPEPSQMAMALGAVALAGVLVLRKRQNHQSRS